MTPYYYVDSESDGWYSQDNEFQNSDNAVVKLLRQTGNPENFYTLDGSYKTILVAKDYVFERNILRAVQSETRLTEEDLAAMAAYLKKSIIDAR